MLRDLSTELWPKENRRASQLISNFLIAKSSPNSKKLRKQLGVDAVGTRVSVLDLSEDFALMCSLTTAGAITCQMRFLEPLCLFLFKTALPLMLFGPTRF
ncbi:hypothetical protein CEXT_663221 [Caerostris extrusa]|uniref:Uncharacterized protein n=1 Tax=Caerostris extrusa TaxID=172846 RepID=A0AAV4X483_CAEEX|nr:hypothetical protein CEXT_663221 [Caerostris extrusa]